MRQLGAVGVDAEQAEHLFGYVFGNNALAAELEDTQQFVGGVEIRLQIVVGERAGGLQQQFLVAVVGAQFFKYFDGLVGRVEMHPTRAGKQGPAFLHFAVAQPRQQ